MKKFLTLLFASQVAASAATTNDIISPLALAEGPYYSGAPWGGSDYRFQQVFAASDFRALTNAGGGIVRAIAFRMDGFLSHDYNGTLTNVQIRLSTTLRSPDALYPRYTDNIGPDETLVVNEAAIRLFIIGSSSGHVQPFLFSMATQPFFYNPAAGNLLMDVYVGRGGIGYMDAVNRDNDSVSSIGGPASDPLGFILGSGPASVGLVTRFTFEPIPEPSVLTLLVAGCSGWLVLRRFGRRSLLCR